MRWDEFLADERQEQKLRKGTLVMLDDVHCFSWTVGDADRYEDHGWPHRQWGDGRDMVIQGIQVNHRTADGNTCGGHVNFARPLSPSDREQNWMIWDVQSLEPLTISPSVLCSCGEHGFIREGRWVGV